MWTEGEECRRDELLLPLASLRKEYKIEDLEGLSYLERSTKSDLLAIFDRAIERGTVRKDRTASEREGLSKLWCDHPDWINELGGGTL
jgi:hypothetical protein